MQAVETGEAALELLLARSTTSPAFDVVVLDVMLPGKRRFTVVAEMRQAGQFVPTLMLTARGRPEDVLDGFAAGADDYLPKPFELSILIARIRGLLRRKQWLRSSVNQPRRQPAPKSLRIRRQIHPLSTCLKFVRRRVYPLTLMEASILRFLVDQEGKAVSRKSMLQEVWGLREDTDTRAIDNFIVRLRRYLEDDPAHPRHLVTVRGIGYRFVASA